jgi:lysophospholipase L1-like esterase
VALGDSFTEGLCDPCLTGEYQWRGWADRVAEQLAVRAGQHGQGFRYANLAVRSRLLPQIVAEQVPAAIELGADLVTLVGGGNDLLRPGADVDAAAAELDGAVARLRATGADVVLCTAYDPRGIPLLGRLRPTCAVFSAHVWAIARRHGAQVLDAWGLSAQFDRRMWATDRVHLTAAGHHRIAAQVLQLLSAGPGGMPEPAPARLSVAPPRRAALAPGPATWREDVDWVRRHLLPWAGRQLQGRIGRHDVPAKRPQLQPVGSSGAA